MRRGPRHRRLGLPPSVVIPNLESAPPVRRYSWVWASIPGLTLIRTVGARCSGGDESLDPVHLDQGIDDDAADSSLQCLSQLIGRLVVPVENEPMGRDAGRQRGVDLATGCHIEQEALVVGEPGHRPAQKAFVA